MKYLFILLFVSLVSCMGNSNQNKYESSASGYDTTKNYTIGQYKNVEVTLNPYITQIDTIPVLGCNDQNSKEICFNNIINQFPIIETPLEFGPVPEPSYAVNTVFEDSLFIVNCLNDTTFYKQERGDRTYGYLKGKIIDKNPNYFLVVILFTYSVGFEYELYSLTLNGNLISKIGLGGQTSDWYEIYGKINNKNTFEITRNEFAMKNGKFGIKTSVLSKYFISTEGQFLKQ